MKLSPNGDSQGFNDIDPETLLANVLFSLERRAIRDVWVGALVTAALFELGKLLIGLYLGKSGITESFQAAGSLVVLLAWVYYAAQIFLLGAEFTKVYAQAHGSLAQAGAPPAARSGPSRAGLGD